MTVTSVISYLRKTIQYVIILVKLFIQNTKQNKYSTFKLCLFFGSCIVQSRIWDYFAFIRIKLVFISTLLIEKCIIKHSILDKWF